MSSLELRPRFKKHISLKPEEIIRRIREYVQNPDRKVEATTVSNHAILRILAEKQHYWSPQLSLEIHEENEGASLRGLYGPSPKVWTMFIFLYMGIGFIGLIGLLYGLSQWSLAMAPTGLWILLAAVTLEIIFYFIARTGKQIAAEQMLHLQKELENILK